MTLLEYIDEMAKAAASAALEAETQAKAKTQAEAAQAAAAKAAAQAAALKEHASLAALGRTLGLSRSYMHHLAYGRRRPTLKLIKKFEKETGGKVRFRDWFAIKDQSEAA